MTTVNFGLIGCGQIAETHAQALLELGGRARLASCSDTDQERGSAFALRHGVDFRPVDDILADESIEAVIVATPSGLHSECGARALIAGKHVVVEKPMDVSLAACDRLLAAQQESGTFLTVMSQTRFDFGAQELKKLVSHGALGNLVVADCRVLWFRGQEYYDADEWRGTWGLDGGGALINQGIHALDLLLWMCGPVQSVYATTRTANHRIEVEDVVCATLQFESGCVATLAASTSVYPGFPVRITLSGTLGSAVLEGGRLSTVSTVGVGSSALGGPYQQAVLVAQGGTRAAAAAVESYAEAVDPAEVWGEGHRRQLADFCDAIRESRAPLITGVDGREALEVVQAVYSSGRTGRPVRLPTSNARRTSASRADLAGRSASTHSRRA